MLDVEKDFENDFGIMKVQLLPVACLNTGELFIQSVDSFVDLDSLII